MSDTSNGDETPTRKLWVDDVRRPPSPGWTWVKTAAEAIDAVSTGEVGELSLDNDLHPFEHDGLEVIEWMAEHRVWPHLVHIHTDNRLASSKMCRLLERHCYRSVPGRPRSFIRSHRPKSSPAEFMRRNFQHSPKANEKLR